MKKEPYTIYLKEVDWVAKALSKDQSRPIMNVGALACYEGNAVLVATDTHRLHVLRLGPVEEEFPLKTIDLKRILFEARYAKATLIQIAGDLSSVEIGRIAKRTNEPTFSPVFTPVINTVEGTFPNFARVIPLTKRPVSEFFSVNSKYLADATALSSSQSNRVIMYSENAAVKPIVFTPGDDPRWFAVVMPMAMKDSSYFEANKRAQAETDRKNGEAWDAKQKEKKNESK